MSAAAVDGVSDPRYPIGQFVKRSDLTPADVQQCIARVAALPGALLAAVRGMTEAQLATPYRDGGWTVRQVVHHVGDSHLNAYARFKLALTEHRPTLRPYDEDRWVRTNDASLPVKDMLTFVEQIHARLGALLASADDEACRRVIVHPDSGEFTVAQLLSLYAWHGEHHVAHINMVRARS